MKVHKVLRMPRNLHIKRRCPADVRAYIRPLGRQQLLRLLRNLHMKVHKVLRLPRNLHIKRRCPTDVHPTPQPAAKCCACKCCACHEICTSSAGAQPTPERTSETPWQAASAAHSTQMLPAERRCPADTRAYIRPLGWRFTKCCACHEICT